MPFHPTGVSQKLSLSSSAPTVIALESLPADNKIVRVVATSYPGNAVCYINLGSDGVSVNSSNGMPIDLSAGKDQCIGVGNETHIALMMASSSNYEIVVTPGEII